MLGKTAKPYFGDLDTHTYSTFLETLVERLALGTGTPYQDGCWLDITHRMRFKEMVDRAIARCAGGQRVDLEELDEPEEFLRRLRTKYPLLEQRKLLLEDIRYFTDKVCTAPGKPTVCAGYRREYSPLVLFRFSLPAIIDSMQMLCSSFLVPLQLKGFRALMNRFQTF